MDRPIRVLIVEDSEPDALLLIDELRLGGYEAACERVDSPEAMRRALEKQNWDLILADYVVPGFIGLAALELFKAKGIDLPFIIVSGQIGEDIAVQAMKAGAHDYIMKGNLVRLVPAVERELREAEVRRERRQAEEERDRLMEQLREVNGQITLSSIRIQEQADEAKRQAAATNAIFTAIAEGLIVYDSKGEIVRMNPVAANLFGYSAGELEKPIAERAALLRAETVDGRPFPVEKAPAKLALSGEIVRGVVMVLYRPSDAKRVLVAVSAAPIRTTEGEILGAVTVFADITVLREK